MKLLVGEVLMLVGDISRETLRTSVCVRDIERASERERERERARERERERGVSR
jgi:hypothetical protein